MNYRPPYVVAGFLSFVMPASPVVAGFWVIAPGGVLGLGAIGAISALVSEAHEGLVRWVHNLAFLGFAVSAVSFARLATIT